MFVMAKPNRAVLYLQASTRDLTADNQRWKLEAAVAAKGWKMLTVYGGIGSAKERYRLHDAHAGLFRHRQAIDTTTLAGKVMFGMLRVFAECERAMIPSRGHVSRTQARAARKLGIVHRIQRARLPVLALVAA